MTNPSPLGPNASSRATLPRYIQRVFVDGTALPNRVELLPAPGSGLGIVVLKLTITPFDGVDVTFSLFSGSEGGDTRYGPYRITAGFPFTDYCPDGLLYCDDAQPLGVDIITAFVGAAIQLTYVIEPSTLNINP